MQYITHRLCREIQGWQTQVSKNDEFCIKNEGFCIKTEEFCIKNEAFCIDLWLVDAEASESEQPVRYSEEYTKS